MFQVFSNPVVVLVIGVVLGAIMTACLDLFKRSPAVVPQPQQGKSPAGQPEQVKSAVAQGSLTAVAALPTLAAPKPAAVSVVTPAPRRKLFLTWAAVERALKSGAVDEAELAQCLFCTSVAELNLASEYNNDSFEYLHTFFTQAAKSGRLICFNEVEHYNRTTLVQVNELLARNGVAPLSCYPDGTLEQIPMYACVPRVSDGSVEVLWAAHPLLGDWKRCWGRTMEQIEAEFANVEDEPETKAPNWMQELNQPIIDECKRKFEPKKPAADEGEQNFDEQQDGDEGEDPADFWKK